MGASIESLQERVRGEVVEPGDPGYDEARKVYNGMHDRRPRAVVRCVDAADVMATVETARDEGLDLAVHQVLAHGGQVLALRHRADLEPVGGIGAILRF